MKRNTTRSLLAATVFALAATTACEPVTTADPGTYPATSRLGISASGDTLFVALADHDLVRAIDSESGDVIGEVSVPGHPHRLTVLADGRVAVTAKHSGMVHIINPATMTEVSSVLVGSTPFGVIEADGHLVVAVSGENDLARIDLADLSRVKDRVTLNDTDPRGLARGPDGRIFVSHFTSGTLSAVEMEAGRVDANVNLAMPSQPLFFANQVDSLTITPDDAEIVVPHVECNNNPAQFTTGGGFAGSSVEYYVEGATGFPAVVPAVGRVDTALLVSLSDAPSNPNGVPTEIETAGPVPAVINPLNTALLGADFVNGPVAVAMADGGRLELLVNRGSGNVFIRRNTLLDGQRSIMAKIDVGTGADSITLSPDGATAYVFNAFEYTVTAFSVPHITTPKDTGAASVTSYTNDDWSAFGMIPELEPNTVMAAADRILSDEVHEGRELFHAVDSRLTRRGAVSCASCHPGGGDDGVTWAFELGPRQTPPLWGGILGTEPFHWNDEVRDIADISRATIQNRMGGEGLNPNDMNKIGAFLDTLPAPAPPMNADLASVDRGAEIFYSDAAACGECHSGPDFTDNERHDVSTGRGFVDRESDSMFATPPLKGLAHSGPYLHNGSAESLRDVIEQTVLNDRMGKGAHLSAQDVDDLVHFLEQL